LNFQLNHANLPKYPLHIVNLASVRDVASRLPKGYYKEFNALRYRANIYSQHFLTILDAGENADILT
jgi:hypothetical protein